MHLSQKQVFTLILMLLLIIPFIFYVIGKLSVFHASKEHNHTLIQELSFKNYQEPIVVAVEYNYFPLSYFDSPNRRDEQVLIGFNVETARDICLRLNIKCQIKPMLFEDIIPALILDKVQIAVASLSHTKQREQYLTFSKPYYHNHSMLIGSNSTATNFDLEKVESFYNIKFGVQSNTVQESFLRDLARQVNYINEDNIKTYSEFVDLERALYKKEVDLVFTESIVGYEMIKNEEHGLFFDIPLPETLLEHYSHLHIAVSKKNAHEINNINIALNLMLLDGTHQRLSAKYFSFLH